MQIGESLSYGNPGEYVTVKLADGRTVMAIAGNVINSSRVLVIGDYAWSETSPAEISRSIVEVFRSKDTPEITLAETCQLFTVGVWIHLKLNNTGISDNLLIEYASETWSYAQEGAYSAIHACYNRGDGGGQYATKEECMLANRRPVPDHLIGEHYFFYRTSDFITPQNLIRDEYDDIPQVQLLGGNWFSYNPSNRRSDPSLQGFVADESSVFSYEDMLPFYYLEPSNAFVRAKVVITIENEEGLWGERIYERATKINSVVVARETLTAKSYVERATDTDAEFGSLREIYGFIPSFQDSFDNFTGNGGADYLPLTGYTCRVEDGKTICEKYLDSLYEANTDLPAAIAIFYWSKDDYPQDSPSSSGTSYTYNYIEEYLYIESIKIETYRNIAYYLSNSSFTYDYHLTLHTPENAKFELVNLAQKPYPQLKILEDLPPNESMTYYLTSLKDKIYFIAQFGKNQAPELDYQDRTWVKIRVFELAINSDGLTIVRDEEYNYPDFIEQDLDNWQRFWAYSFENSLSGNACFDELKYPHQSATNNTYYREFSYSNNKIYRVPASYLTPDFRYIGDRIIHYPTAFASRQRRALLEDNPAEITIETYTFVVNEAGECIISEVSSQNILFPQFVLDFETSYSIALVHMAVLQACS